MELRLEIILIFLVGFIVWGSFAVDLNGNKKNKTLLTKELEFTNTTFTEVNPDRMMGRAYGTYGVRDAGVLSLKDVVYYTDDIKLLTANKGRYEGDILKLDEDVVMEDMEGYVYSTQHARYNQKRRVLFLDTPFTSQKEKSFFNGSSFIYNLATQKAYAQDVRSTFYTVDK